MAKFRKKPVVIEAWLNEADWGGAPKWLTDAMGTTVFTDFDRLRIATLEGVMVADRGDWIIQGVKGEIYPCKPDIFAATYDPVE